MTTINRAISTLAEFSRGVILEKPQIPKNESERLAILRGYQILDTPPEKLYDNIALLASQICDSPIAVISMVDEKRDWFKAKIGLNFTELSREISFCGHAILQDGVFQIPNARADLRFSDNPHVACDSGIVFFAGAPLKTPSGERVGALCVIDRKPKTLTDRQTESLTALAEQVVALLEMHRRVHVLKASEANFRSIAEATPLIVWTAAPDGAVEYANSKWYSFSGLTPEQTLGSAFTSIIHPDDVVGTMTEYRKSLVAIQPLEIEHRFKRASDGAYRWFLTRALPAFDDQGQVTKWFGTNVDIDDQKRVAAELQEAKTEAERANLTKSAFLANMSHEIRTPIAAIIGFAELLKNEKLARGELTNFVNVIDRNARSLARVIDDILDLSKVEAGRLAIVRSPMSISEVIKDVFVLFADRARVIGIELSSQIDPDVPEFINSDVIRIRQILINVVGNAVKFTEKGSVKVIVGAESTLNNEFILTIRVSDTGRGLTPFQKERLFQPFTQVDNTTTREYGGTGLGLALSRRLAEALGGTVDLIAHGLGEGCTFIITFTAQSAAPTRESSATTSPVGQGLSLNGIRVLLAEDSLDNQFLIERILTGFGAIVSVVENGALAVTRALEGAFDVVLMDIQMPIMDGYTAMSRLKAKGYMGPVVALTAHAMAEEKEKTRTMGFAAHVSKPIDVTDLVRVVQNLPRGVSGSRSRSS